MSLLSNIVSAVASARSKTSSLFTDTVVIVRSSQTYDATTGVVSSKTVRSTISVMVDTWEFGEINGDTVRADDLKLVTMDTISPINQSDQVEFLGSMYTVVKVIPIMAANQLLVRYIQLRK